MIFAVPPRLTFEHNADLQLKWVVGPDPSADAQAIIVEGPLPGSQT